MVTELTHPEELAKKFIETICINEGKAFNLAYHNERMNRTRKMHWGNASAELALEDYIQPDSCDGYTRCRVVYGKEVEEVAYFPYQMRPVYHLKLVVDDEADYSFKSADRSLLNRLFAERGVADDVLIVRRGLITDTSIANVALFDGRYWYTPKHPLLKGICRQILLDGNLIWERDIEVETLNSYQKIRLFNAMIPFGRMELDLDGLFQ